MFRHSHRRPPWWPEDEPGPLPNRAEMWRHGRERFVRRIAFFFAAAAISSIIGLGTIVSKLFGPEVIPHSGSVRGLWIVFGTLLVFGVFLPAMRRVGLPLGNIVEAANRVADGDLSTRVPEYGPSSIRTVGRAFNSMAARLEAQDRQRKHLMADIAHELRTPLSVIQGRLEGLLDGIYSRDDAQISGVLEETRILARLVEDLRTLANAESGMLTLNKESSDMSMLIRDAIQSLVAEATSRKITILFEPPTDLPLVNIDPLRIREVVTNLLSNAIRHSPEGGRISFSVERSAGDLVVSVSDTGAGISPEDLPKIFDRFYKGAASRGSGLGLTIARNFVNAHGGKIWAESELGHGTTVSFTVPLSA